MRASDERDDAPDTLLTPGVESIEDMSAGAQSGGSEGDQTGGTVRSGVGSCITTTESGTSARMGDTLDTHGVGTSNAAESKAPEEVASTEN